MVRFLGPTSRGGIILEQHRPDARPGDPRQAVCRALIRSTRAKSAPNGAKHVSTLFMEHLPASAVCNSSGKAHGDLSPRGTSNCLCLSACHLTVREAACRRHVPRLAMILTYNPRPERLSRRRIGRPTRQNSVFGENGGHGGGLYVGGARRGGARKYRQRRAGANAPSTSSWEWRLLSF